MGFTSEDHEKFKELRLTPLAEKFEELIADESHDHQLPEEVFMAAVDHALDARRSNKVDRLIKQAKFPLPSASIAEIHYVPGRKLEESRMKRFATHQWRADTTNLMVISATGRARRTLFARSVLPPATRSIPWLTRGWTTWPGSCSSRETTGWDIKICC